ncbi:chromogranin-A [Narcine bancroftii]|uniref:chromogranin-A n=1 Tax=Narcine bancroftii TaxID=1343680 RepID=UPI003831EC90
MTALVLFALLLAGQAFSSPVPVQPPKADTKIMNCVVEVLSDTLSKPSPLPISQECMEALRGDERIINMLRHQNLLRELQEIAADGANEKALQMKQSNDYKEKHLPGLKNQDNKKIPQKNLADEYQRTSTEKMEIEEGRQPYASSHSFMNIEDTTTDSSIIATDRNRGTVRRVPIEDESIKNASSENESDVDQSQDHEQREEHSTEAHEDQFTEEVSEDEITKSEEENDDNYEDSKDEKIVYSEEPSQEDWEDEATNSDSSDMEENGTVSDEEIKFNEYNKGHQSSGKLEEEYSSKSGEKDELPEEWKEKKPKMDEYAPDQKVKHEEISQEDKLIRFENPTPHGRRGRFQRLQGNRRSNPEEDGQKKMSTASTVLRRKLDGVEDKKEEEGSAIRKNEEQVESLEEMESELEAMARRLHQMRSS